MASQRTNIPSFGIRGRQISTYSTSIDESSAKLTDLNDKTEGTPGAITLNSNDGRLYYYDGQQWCPLLIDYGLFKPENDHNISVRAPPTWGLHLKSGDDIQGIGRNLRISTGLGGIADGEMYLDIGGENALTIKKTGDIVIKGNLELENPNAHIKSIISRAQVTMDEKDNDKVTMDGPRGILSITLKLKEEDTYSGTLENELICENSWVNVSVASDSGVPMVWLSEQKEGSIKYTVRCVKEELFDVKLHFSVYNSV